VSILKKFISKTYKLLSASERHIDSFTKREAFASKGVNLVQNLWYAIFA